MNIIWLISTTVLLWIAFGLYVDSQQGPVKRAILQRVGSLVLLLAAMSILIYGA